MSVTRIGRLLAVSAGVVAGPLLMTAHSDAAPGHASSAVGQPGKASAATRTVEIVMRDNMYEPAFVEVKAGETVRFVLENDGELLHEFNIGTAAMHADHQKQMAMMMDHGMLTPTRMVEPDEMDHSTMSGMSMSQMEHDDPNSVLVEPGETGQLVWTFTETTRLEFACNIPGHYESGMAGDIRFTN
ncbi:cupredoxin domain-containing protein [Marinivivus vitaminiproducens]|uniref:cupredoxin domain-containing protein n=1 Tax=Marinivivus vitaminiproducens TaxID=3035935 RepID=UPI00279A357F|nr:cupredoxin family protein [Geminicoccaceae bacterium SCSIO 64248]